LDKKVIQKHFDLLSGKPIENTPQEESELPLFMETKN